MSGMTVKSGLRGRSKCSRTRGSIVGDHIKRGWVCSFVNYMPEFLASSLQSVECDVLAVILYTLRYRCASGCVQTE